MKNKRLEWYLNAKFGLFIHWGAYAVAGVEASWPVMAPDLSEAMFRVPSEISEKDYTSLPAKFNPVDYEPRKWVKCASDAGIRYIVFTSKHHDGFCMFDAPGTDYKITNTAYKRDVCLELSEACAEFNMPLGFYYSPPDMNHPGYRDISKPMTRNWTGEPKRPEWNEYLDYMESHIRKLLTGYGHISLIWFDGLANHGKYDPERFHRLIHELSPDTLINDRLGPGFDFVTPEQFIPKSGIPAHNVKPPSGMDPDGDWFFRMICGMFRIPGLHGFIKRKMEKYADGELELSPVHQEPYPSPERFQAWETCMTIGSTWAYNPAESAWKAPSVLIANLTGVICKGGNYLLNVGPDGTGRFPEAAVERLKQIGEWTGKYEKVVYSSTYSPVIPQTWGSTALCGEQLILFVSKWPENGILRIENFPYTVRSASIYDGENLEFSRTPDAFEISVPAAPPDPFVSVIAVDIDGKESRWTDYSDPVDPRQSVEEYTREKAVACGWINSVLNGLIAFFAYLPYSSFTFKQIANDILITIGIIVFINAWLLIGTAGKDYKKGNIRPGKKSLRGLRLPANSVLGALLITLLMVIVFGGVLSGIIFIISPSGLPAWVYTIIKTLYTGCSAALAAVIAVRGSLKRDLI